MAGCRLMHGLEVHGGVIRKSIFRIVVAAVVAGLIVFLTSGPPKANAPTGERPSPQLLAKAERLAEPARGSACSQQGWPNFEHSCQFDLRQPAGESRAVRVIALR
jgi:hypothetical protein